MAIDDLRNVVNNVQDAVTFPILTQETSYDGAAAAPAARGPENGSVTRQAQQTIREVLGWRYRSDDHRGFLAALNKSFDLAEVEGHVEWKWKAQSYLLQADLGEITGAQASIHKQASNSVAQALPLLEGITALRADVDTEDTEALRAIIRSELNQLVSELAMTGGPRVQRVDLFFLGLLGSTVSSDPEQVGGQLGRLRERFGLERARVNTVMEEQNYTNFLIFVDYVLNLAASWASKRAFFMRGAGPEPFLGTQLVLLSQALEVIIEQVREAYAAMDSVFFGPAERQATVLNLPGEPPITVGELLGWVECFAASEGTLLLQDGGKDGIVSFRQTMERLTQLVAAAARHSLAPSSNPVRAFHTKRVAVSLEGLAIHLQAATDLASGIRRRPFLSAQIEGRDENVPLPVPPGPRRALARVDSIQVIGWDGLQGYPRFRPGDLVRLNALGQNLSGGEAFDLGEGVQLLTTRRVSSHKVRVKARILETAKPGFRTVTVSSAGRTLGVFPETFAIEVAAPRVLENIEATFEPRCVVAGQRARLCFRGANLDDAGVRIQGDGIAVEAAQYRRSKDGKQYEILLSIQVAREAVPGPRTVWIFNSSVTVALAEKLLVEAPPAEIGVVYLDSERQFRRKGHHHHGAADGDIVDEDDDDTDDDTDEDTDDDDTDDEDTDDDDTDDDDTDDDGDKPEPDAGGSEASPEDHDPDKPADAEVPPIAETPIPGPPDPGPVILAESTEVPASTSEVPDSQLQQFIIDFAVTDGVVRAYRQRPWTLPRPFLKSKTFEVPLQVPPDKIKRAALLAPGREPLVGRVYKRKGGSVVEFDTTRAEPGEYYFVSKLADDCVEITPIGVAAKSETETR